MFSRKEKNKSSVSGGTSKHVDTTTVHQSNNGITVTRQVSSESRHVQKSVVEERSVFVSNTTNAFPFPLTNPSRFSLDSRSPLGTLSESRNRLLSANSANNGNILAIQNDATPFTFRPGSLSTSTSESSPTSSRFPPSASINPSASANWRLRQTTTPSAAAPTDHVVPTYLHKNIKLGKALIINNVKFMEEKEERQGAKKDSEDLKKVLNKLGFEVEHKMDLKGKDMSKRVTEFSKSNFTRHDIALVVIMSHGNNLVHDGKTISRVRGGFTQIAGVDNVPLLTDDVIEQFVGAKCHPSLKGKPKIFIFQCCRGEKDLEVCKDATPMRVQSKEYADILIAFSTLPGYLSNRNPTTGTWYIQSLCEVFERYQKEYHVEELLKIVDDQLSNKHPKYSQTSTYESRGFKRCYLYKNSS